MQYASRQQQQQHVTQWKTSGLSRAQYARQHQICTKTLTRWIARWSPPALPASGPLIPAVIIPGPSPGTASVTLNLKCCSVTCLPGQLPAIMEVLNLC